MEYKKYLGLDVSEYIVNFCRERFAEDETKTFKVIDASMNLDTYELSVSLDVIFHLIEDEVYSHYMRNLFKFASRYVCIYNLDANSPAWSHVRFRKHSEYIEKHFPDWILCKCVPNKYPFDIEDRNNTSFCDFYFYRHKDEYNYNF
jgi:hypothetical protein